MNRKYDPIVLTEQEISTLYEITDTGVHAARAIKRARVLLKLHEQCLDNDAVAEECGCRSTSTVYAVARRYRAGGLQAALYDAQRPGAKPKFSADDEARITAIACSAPPDGRKSWTLRLLASKVVELELADNVAPATIRSVLKKTNSRRIRKSSGVLAKSAPRL